MKRVVIIGGSRGIGKAIALSEVSLGNEVISINRNKTEDSIEGVQYHYLDVLTDDLPQIERIDKLIYCPGSINLRPIHKLKLSDFQSDFNINVLGAVKVIQYYLEALKKGDEPSILLFSSVAMNLGMPFHSSIAAAKGAVEGLVKSLGAELAPSIRINAIAPTITNTDLAKRLLRNDKMKEMMIHRHPLKKYLEPEEVAGMASFLMSEKAASISGQTITLDSGLTTFKI